MSFLSMTLILVATSSSPITHIKDRSEPTSITSVKSAFDKIESEATLENRDDSENEDKLETKENESTENSEEESTKGGLLNE